MEWPVELKAKDFAENRQYMRTYKNGEKTLKYPEISLIWAILWLPILNFLKKSPTFYIFALEMNGLHVCICIILSFLFVSFEYENNIF